MRIFKKKNQEGFTLVELMIVVAIIGILAVLAIYGVSKYMANAKTGEARNALGQIAKGAVAAYEDEKGDNTILPASGTGGAITHVLCGSANLVPTNIPAAQKYQSSVSDWGGTSKVGWACLKFSLTEPQYFQYGYTAMTTGSQFFNASAEAKLAGGTDADKAFKIGGKVDTTTGQIRVSQQLAEADGALSTIPDPAN